MSGISMPRDLFVSYISEQIGFKTGFALSFDELISHVDITSEFYAQLTGTSECVSINFNDLLDSFQLLLHRLGTLPHPVAYHAPTFFRVRYCNNPVYEPAVEGIFNLLSGEVDWILPKPGKELKLFLITASERWGTLGGKLAKEVIDMMYLYRIGALCELDRFRRVEWKSTIELRELFSSESLDAAYGNFIDQRFIDYLAKNFTSIDSMNWRKFEGLAGEFFVRTGYAVEMGAGRGDGGIDIRAWKQGTDEKSPPTIIIQCKRQRSSVEQVIVKALWADVVHEGAESGLIVTSSRLAPAAQRVCSARAYQVTSAERNTLKRWLETLRTPGSGMVTNG